MINIPKYCRIIIISGDEVYDVGVIESFLNFQKGISHELLINLDDLVKEDSNKDLGVVIYIDRYADGVCLGKQNSSFNKVKRFLRGIPVLKIKKVVDPTNQHLVEEPKEQYVFTIKNAPSDGKIEIIDSLKEYLSELYPFSYKVI